MASSNLTPAQQQALDDAFRRILRVNGGLVEDLPVSISTAINPHVTEARDFYVDGTNGNDASDGSTSQPFRTIGRAVKEILLGNDFTVRIFVRAGTYQEVVRIEALTPYSASIQIIGTDYVRATATTGSATGTATSYSTTTKKLLVTGAGWTPGNFKGCLLRFTSGSLSAGTQLPFPIYDNTATELEIPVSDASVASAAAGATFEIVKPAATLRFPTTPTTGLRYALESAVYGGTALGGLVVQNMILDGTNGTAVASVSGAIQFQGCIFQNIGSTAAGIVGSVSPGSTFRIYNSYINAPRVFTGPLTGSSLFLRNSVFITTVGHQFQLDYPGCYVALQKTCFFETVGGGSGGAIFSLKVGQATIYSTEEMVVKNCGHVIKAEGGNNNITFSQRLNLVSSNTQNGAIWLTEGGAFAGGGNRIFITNASVSACTGSFVAMETFHNSVWIANSTISGCTGTAIKMSNTIGTGIAGCFNFVSAYNTTMSGNGADFSVDGTATLTKAAALSAGTTTNSTLFNRLVVT